MVYKGKVQIIDQLCVCALSGKLGVVVLVMLLTERLFGLLRALY